MREFQSQPAGGLGGDLRNPIGVSFVLRHLNLTKPIKGMQMSLTSIRTLHHEATLLRRQTEEQNLIFGSDAGTCKLRKVWPWSDHSSNKSQQMFIESLLCAVGCRSPSRAREEEAVLTELTPHLGKVK